MVEVLLHEARTGNAEAFEALVRPHLSMFYGGIHRILGEEAESQDALQDALVSMHKELGRFQGQSAFSTWAYRICINAALMARRKRMRRREDALEDLMPHFEGEGHHMDQDRVLAWSEAADAFERTHAGELRARVRAALDRLTDEQRAVFVLKDLEEWETEDIARHLGISRDLVRQRLHRARVAMRTLLADFAMDGGRS